MPASLQAPGLDAATPPRVFARRWALWLLYLLPLAYLAQTASVIVHELLGHGLVAWMAGGHFIGFVIKFDYGWAYAWSERCQNLVLAGGVTSEVLVGIVCLALARLRRVPLLLRAGFGLLAVTLLQNGFSYAFWNTVYPNPPGDFGRILQSLNPGDRSMWTLVLMATLGPAYVVFTLVSILALFRCIEEGIGRLSAAQAAILAGVLGAAGAALWLSFDWSQMIEGVGRQPQLGGTAIHVGACAVLVFRRRKSVEAAPLTRRQWAIAIGVAWSSTVVLLALVALKLQHGVMWGTYEPV